MREPRVIKKSVSLSLLSRKLGTASPIWFFGHVNFGFWLGVEYQPWSLWNFTPTDQKWKKIQWMSRGIWILCLWLCFCQFEKLGLNEFSSCICYTCYSFLSKAMNMCLIRAHIFRWWDQHVALITVLERRVVVTNHRHRPWRRRRHLWPLKSKCCARSYRRISR
jgi:hypothetical protein